MQAPLTSEGILAWIAEFMTNSGRPCSVKSLRHESFHALGADSVLSVELAFALGETLGLEIDPTLIYDSRTIQGFAESVLALYARTPGRAQAVGASFGE
ncbi:acyl carrier protein [Burkholderia sp. Bp9002]|nr:acyl carrier protein [Burkholderia sp. Bp9002]